MRTAPKYFAYICLYSGECSRKRQDKKIGVPICYARYFNEKADYHCNQQYQVSYNALWMYKDRILEIRRRRRRKQ